MNKQQIDGMQLENRLQNPEQLESLYRKNPASFKRQFLALYPSLKENRLADAWHARLTYTDETIQIPLQERLFIVVAALLSGFFVKLPEWAGWLQDEYMIRYFPFLVLPFLIAYFLWKRGASQRSLSVYFAGIAGFVVYMSFLTYDPGSDVLSLVMMHMLLVLWFLTGTAYDTGRLEDGGNTSRGNAPGGNAPSLDFLRYNGDVVVTAAVLALSGALLTAITFGLFSLTPLNIEQFFESYIVIWGGPAIVISAFFLAETQPGLVSKVAPVIARIFTPVAGVVLFLFLMAFFFTDVDLFDDRSVLMVFNVMLIGVMALTLFSLSGTTAKDGSLASDPEDGAAPSSTRINRLMQTVLIALALVIGVLALAAIVYRVWNFGFTPNRTVVLGSNLLILIHLAWIGWVLVRKGFGGGRNVQAERVDAGGLDEPETIISRYLPAYFYWALAVVFLFPLLF